jgi:hypothetical protein
MASIYYDTFWLQNVETHYVQLRIAKVDIYSEKSRIVLEKTIPIVFQKNNFIMSL